MGKVSSMAGLLLTVLAGFAVGCGEDPPPRPSASPSDGTLAGQPAARPNSFLPHSDQRLASRFTRATGVLAGLGWRFDPAGCEIEVCSWDDMVDVMSRAPAYDDPLGKTGGALFRRRVLHLAHDVDPVPAGLFDRRTNRILILDAGFGNPITADGTLAHEAVHAFQEEAGRLAPLQAARRTESRWLQLALVEGEAELGRVAYLAAVHDGDLARIPLATLERIHGQGLLAGWLRAHYVDGLLHFLRRRRAQPRSGADAVFEAPPASAEQLLHPTKLGVDAPAAVVLPEAGHAAGWTRVGVDTVGEFFVRCWLAVFETLPRAKRLACGWDGDTVAVYEHAQHGQAVVWALVWDRPEDAEQFHRVVERWLPAPMRRQGRLVVCAAGPDGELGALLDWAARSIEVPSVGPRDAETTAAIEAAWQPRAEDPALDGGWWKLPALGISLPVAEGWFQERLYGRTLLRATSTERDAWPSIELDVVLLGRPVRLEEIEGRFDALAHGASNERVIGHERVTLRGDLDAVLVHHTIGVGTQWVPWHYLSLYVPAPWGALTLHGRVSHADHDARWSQVRASLLAARFESLLR